MSAQYTFLDYDSCFLNLDSYIPIYPLCVYNIQITILELYCSLYKLINYYVNYSLYNLLLCNNLNVLIDKISRFNNN